jgi:peptide/nickel transport system permease protein
MKRYIAKRILQMIPTVLGVILITFVLFNIVGGSPAAIILGQNVSPKALEEFDEERGFNKPLFFGNWTRTRAFPDQFFLRDAGLFKNDPQVRYECRDGQGYITIGKNNVLKLPIAFKLWQNNTYEWCLTYRVNGGNGGSARIIVRGGKGDVERVMQRNSGDGWSKAQIKFITPEFLTNITTDLVVSNCMLEVSKIELRRKTKHFFDSQLIFYFAQLLKLDFGTSVSSNQKISTMLKEGILPSLSLTVPIFIIGLITSISVSLLCAFFKDTWFDRITVVFSVVLLSVNYLVWIVCGQYIFGYKLGWLPLWGYESPVYLLLPVCIGVFSGIGEQIRFYRTIMLDEMYKEYVRTAFAKGLSRRAVLFRHVLKNAMIPILTNVIIAIPFLYTGSLLLEQFFGVPGLGNMVVNALNYCDVDVVRAVVFIGAILFVIANLLTDICYALVDPRVKLE